MSLSLNTSHALYSNIQMLVCVDGGALKDLKTPGRTFTKHSEATYGTGTFGEHLRTLSSGGVYTPKGASFSPSFWFDHSDASHNWSIFVAFNRQVGGAGYRLLAGSTNPPAAQVLPELDAWGHYFEGTSDGAITSTGADTSTAGGHTVCLTRPGGFQAASTGGQKIYVDNALAGSGTGGPFYAGYGEMDLLGGSNGLGVTDYDLVYYVVFDKILTLAEYQSLHGSLTGSNAFGLVTSSGSTGAATGALAARSMSAAVGYASAGGVGNASGAMSARAISAIAGYASGGSAGSFQTDIMGNNTGSPWANTAIHWTWTASGRIGSMNGRTTIDGTGTTDANGRYLLTSVSAGAGVFMAARWVTNATDDDVYYQAGTVA